MNQFYTQTTLPAPNINYKKIWPNSPTDITDNIPRWRAYPLIGAKNLFWTKEIRESLSAENIFPTVVRIFRWRPNGSFPWHIDGTNSETTMFAINWVLEGTGLIQWNSKLILPKPDKNYKHLAAGTKDSTLHDTYEESAFGHGCLVNTTIPHRVVNNSDVHRITLSIQFGNHFTYKEVREKLSALGFIA